MAHTPDDLTAFAEAVLESIEHMFEHPPRFEVSQRATKRRWATTKAGSIRKPRTSKIILYAPQLRELDVDALEDVILHELAHALQWERHGKMAHDSQWRDYCEGLGALPRSFADEAERVAYASTRGR